ncbi:MAG TPA: RNA polymerase factor sigma-54 [Ktedonobacteraceae bacterium]|nr:RNA polymerase factor sigma-54 [Ktedonobacteraceae bacterium]
MRLDPTPRPEQTLRVSARLITASNILHLSSDELERAVAQEQMENPALEVIEQRICLFCGSPLRGPVCASCGASAQQAQPAFNAVEHIQVDEGAAEQQWNDYAAFDIYDYSAATDSDEEEELDPMARLAMDQSLAETLLQQLESLVEPDELPIAEQLVGNLNERGYLEIGVSDIAAYLEVPVDRVERVLSLLQTLDPPGIGARDARECLLIQLAILHEHETPHPLAAPLIDRYLDRLGKSQFHEIARELKVPEHNVRQAAQYIRSNLYPFPAHTYQPGATGGQGAIYTRPDVIIRKGEHGFEVELIEEKRYGFHIGPGYGTQPLSLEHDPAFDEMQRYMRAHSDRAKFFIDCILRRWRTLKLVTELIVDYQREFLEKGVRFLRPFTRAEVAARLNLDESTVSRATAHKYAMLPNGRLMPLADFFDGSLGIKDVLRELITAEDPKHRLSDDELARLMTARGIPMARRTVTKYREEMGIASSRER